MNLEKLKQRIDILENKELIHEVDGIVFVDDAGNIVEPDEQGTEIIEMTPELKQKIEANYRKNL